MSKQILDISQMQHLKVLGVDTSKASMCWLKDLTNEIAEGKEIDMSTGWNIDFNNPEYYKYDWMEGIPTFTLQDILDLLPKEIEVEKSFFFDTFYLYMDFECDQIKYAYNDSYEGLYEYKCSDFSEDNSLIDAAYYMLCWCIENGYVKTEKEDKVCQ